jgi:hypothetical protein
MYVAEHLKAAPRRHSYNLMIKQLRFTEMRDTPCIAGKIETTEKQ